MTLWQVLVLGGFAEFPEDELGDFLEGFKDAGAVDGSGFQSGLAFDLQVLLQFFDGQDVGEVALIELKDVGDGADVEAVLFRGETGRATGWLSRAERSLKRG